jgi:exopolysaccharide production protein ExoZ
MAGTKSTTVYGIQACRAFAALLVVCFHSAGNLAKDKYFGEIAAPMERFFWFGGDAGVAFFFVLSGFIIHHVHARDFDRPDTLFKYLKKRAIRIYPTYWIMFALVFGAASTLPSMRDGVQLGFLTVLKSLILMPQDSKVVGGTGAPVIVVAWSLQYEIMFYIVFSIGLIKRWAFYFVAAALSFNMVIHPCMDACEFPRGFFSNHLIALFGMGVLASLASGKTAMQGRLFGWLVLASVLVFATTAVMATSNRSVYQKTWFDLAFGLASALLVYGLSKSNSNVDPLPLTKGMASLGDSSYALYLMHYPIVSLLSKIAVLALPISMWGAGSAMVFMVLTCTLMAWAFNRYVERPMLSQLFVVLGR